MCAPDGPPVVADARQSAGDHPRTGNAVHAPFLVSDAYRAYSLNYTRATLGLPIPLHPGAAKFYSKGNGKSS